MITDNNLKRLPKHVGIIPDGNRRWAVSHQLQKKDGYQHGIAPGFRLYELLLEYGIQEATFYGFTQDNNRRPSEQVQSFSKACVDAVKLLANRDADILVIGKTDSRMFPEELKPYANKRVRFGKGLIRLNFLVNYDWQWDLNYDGGGSSSRDIVNTMASRDISKVDLLIRWGGHTRLSGFLPVQTVYADFYIINENWPDFHDRHFIDALNWYQTCDVTRGG